MNIPNFIDSKVIDENGMLTDTWKQVFTQLFGSLQGGLSDEGIALPNQTTANIAIIADPNKSGATLYNETTNKVMCNFNGVFKNLVEDGGTGSLSQLQLTGLTPDTALIADSNKHIASSITTSTELESVHYATDLDTANTLVKRNSIGNSSLGLNDTQITPIQCLDNSSRQLLDSTAIGVLDWNLLNLINPSTGLASMEWGIGNMDDVAGYSSVNWYNRISSDNIGNYSIDWQNRFLYDHSPSFSVDWENRILYDDGSAYSIDWTNRYGFNTSGISTIDYGNSYLIQNSGGGSDISSNSVDWQNFQLYGVWRHSRPIFPPVYSWSAFLSVDWTNCVLYSTPPAELSPSTQSIDWQNRALYAADNTQRYNWNLGQLSDDTGVTAIQFGSGNYLLSAPTTGNVTVDWSNCALNDSSDQTGSIDWQNRLLCDNNPPSPDTFGVTSLDWKNRTLNDTSGNAVINFSTLAEIKIAMQLDPQSSAPSSPTDGMMYVGGTAGSRHLYIYLNSAWHTIV
jgi:hypothetical protein